jgi:hypothetical protein
LPNTGFKPPSANQAATSGSGDNNGFETTPANAYTSNNAFAVDNNSGTTTSSSYTDPGKDRHLFYNFNFGLLSGVAVAGIEVRLEGKADNTTSAPTMYVELSWDGGTSWTAAKATATLTKNDVIYTLGGTNDMWGRTWTVAELDSALFRVRITNVATNISRDFSLDQIAVRVSYQ